MSADRVRSCPLCGSSKPSRSGFSSARFEGQVYDYTECLTCGSAACDPMPAVDVLARMYGCDYQNAGGTDAVGDGPDAADSVLAQLARRQSGTLVDFGCGSGALLAAARGIGWATFGVEFDAAVARDAATRAGCEVVCSIDELHGIGAVPADVIHLGDVVEHLPSPLDVLMTLVGLLRPNGWLLAAGPLEAGPCLFASLVRRTRRLRSAPPVDMPPYHVTLATVRGQRLLFERAGLKTLDYRVSEVSWPAPARLTPAVLRDPRSLGLFLLRRASQAVSLFAPGRLGNRYTYVGKPHRSPANEDELLLPRRDSDLRRAGDTVSR